MDDRRGLVILDRREASGTGDVEERLLDAAFGPGRMDALRRAERELVGEWLAASPGPTWVPAAPPAPDPDPDPMDEEMPEPIVARMEPIAPEVEPYVMRNALADETGEEYLLRRAIERRRPDL